jgi:hypothetical protein
MAEEEQAIVGAVEQKLGDRIVGGLAVGFLYDTLAKGMCIYFVHERVVVTPGREMKNVEELTPEERKRNPLIP